MKLSVSLRDEDVAALDEYVRSKRLPSRSAAIRHAIRYLRYPKLEEQYAEAWDEWVESGEEALWDQTTGDGIDDER